MTYLEESYVITPLGDQQRWFFATMAYIRAVSQKRMSFYERIAVGDMLAWLEMARAARDEMSAVPMGVPARWQTHPEFQKSLGISLHTSRR